MAPSLDEQGVEEEEACSRTSQNTPHTQQSCLRPHIPEDGSGPRTPTFEREAIVPYAFTQILPYHVFHIFQRTRFQWGVEARPLRTTRQNIPIVTMIQKASCPLLTLHQQQTSVHLEKVELGIVEYPVIVQV